MSNPVQGLLFGDPQVEWLSAGTFVYRGMTATRESENRRWVIQRGPRKLWSAQARTVLGVKTLIDAYLEGARWMI